MRSIIKPVSESTRSADESRSLLPTRERIGALGLKLATPSVAGMYGSMTAFELPIKGAAKAAALRQEIWKHRIEVPIVERPDRLLLAFQRISTTRMRRSIG